MTVDLNEIFTVNFTKMNFIVLYLIGWIGEKIIGEVLEVSKAFKFKSFSVYDNLKNISKLQYQRWTLLYTTLIR